MSTQTYCSTQDKQGRILYWQILKSGKRKRIPAKVALKQKEILDCSEVLGASPRRPSPKKPSPKKRKEEVEDLNKKTIKQLKWLMGREHISYPKNARKAELIQLIINARKAGVEEVKKSSPKKTPKKKSFIPSKKPYDIESIKAPPGWGTFKMAGYTFFKSDVKTENPVDPFFGEIELGNSKLKNKLYYFAGCMPGNPGFKGVEEECTAATMFSMRRYDVEKYEDEYYDLSEAERKQVKKRALEYLSREYKIHLMPKEDEAISIFEEVLRILNNHFPGISAKIKNTYSHVLGKQIYPVIVIYCHLGFKDCKKLYQLIYSEFANIKGTDQTPRYNLKVTSLIYYAGGDGDAKKAFDSPNPYVEKMFKINERGIWRPGYELFSTQEPL